MPRPRTTLSQSTSSSRNRNSFKESNLCQFPFADGRRCRMLRHPAHPYLCLTHAHSELQLQESGRLGTELSQTLTGDFMTATDVNHVLGRLYTAIAQDRIPPRNAATLAYVGQLLLQSVAGVKSEFTFAYSFDQWNDLLDKAKPLSPPTTVAPTALNHPTATAIHPSPQPEPSPNPGAHNECATISAKDAVKPDS